MTTYSNSGRQRPTPQIAVTTIPGDAAHEIARRDVIIENLRALLAKRTDAIANALALQPFLVTVGDRTEEHLFAIDVYEALAWAASDGS